jgi:hypothetical protein
MGHSTRCPTIRTLEVVSYRKGIEGGVLKIGSE